jgi:hypothetical protein
MYPGILPSYLPKLGANKRLRINLGQSGSTRRGFVLPVSLDRVAMGLSPQERAAFDNRKLYHAHQRSRRVALDSQNSAAARD